MWREVNQHFKAPPIIYIRRFDTSYFSMNFWDQSLLMGKRGPTKQEGGGPPQVNFMPYKEGEGRNSFSHAETEVATTLFEVLI